MIEKEKILIAGCVRGDKDAWDAFVLQYSALVYHTIKKTFSLYHTEPHTDRLEDLCQQFFVSILRDDFKKLRQFRGDGGCTLAGWLRVVATRLTIDFLRKRDVPTAEITESLSQNQPDSSDSMIEEQEEKLVSAAVANLSARDRIFIDLYYRQALPPEDIVFLRSL